MVKKVMVLALVVLLISCCEKGRVESQGIGCVDSCTTGCVQPDPRIMLRCERKCDIKCSPDAAVEGEGHLR